MGFFSWFGRKVGKVIEKVGDKVAEKTGWYGISELGTAIQDICSEEVSKERSYDKNEANVLTTERLNEILVSFSERYLQHCENLEEQCIEEVEDYCNALIDLLEESSEFTKDNSNLKRVKRNRSKIRTTIIGSLKEPLAKRMSLDDPECLKILKLDSGKEKEKAMKKFSKKIIRESLNNLAMKVTDVLQEQTEGIEEYFTDYAESQEKKVKIAKRQYEAMLKEGRSKESDIEKSIMEPMAVLKAAELVKSII